MTAPVAVARAAKAAKGAKAAKAAGSVGAAARKPGKLRHQPSNLTGLDPSDHAEELDLRKQDAAWAKEERVAGRDPDRDTFSGEPSSVPGGTDDVVEPGPSAAASPSGGRSRSSVRLPDTGGGLVLGGLLYVLGLTYLRDGGPGVKKLLRAKFLNKTAS